MISPEIALFYKSQGISIIPCKDKRPVSKWGFAQNEIMSDEDIHKLFPAKEIGLVGGVVSGGLEILDFDLKHLPESKRDLFWTKFKEDIVELLPSVYSKLQIHKTQSGGYHILYRCEEIEGNKKIAKVKVENRFECIIETRGEGGYVIGPPSPGYSLETEGKFEIHLLDVEERYTLMAICKSYNEEPEAEVNKSITKKKHQSLKKNPFDDYNESDDFMDVLIENGWKLVQESGERVFFRRPGSDNFQSANWHKQKRIFFVFSSGDVHLEGQKGYSPSQIYTIFKHKGDYSASFRALLGSGYGAKWSSEELSVIQSSKVKLTNNADVIKVKSDLQKNYPDWLDTDIDKIIDVSASIKDGKFYNYIKEKIQVNMVDYVKFLSETLGYYLWADSTEFEKPLIKVDKVNHQVEIIYSDASVKEDVKQYLFDNLDDEVPASEIINHLMTKDMKLFNRKTYEWLPLLSFETFNDTISESYFFFRNGIVSVNKSRVTMIDYKDLPQNTFIWKNRIKNKDYNIELLQNNYDEYISKSYSYTYTDKDTGEKAIGVGSAWYKYFRRISGITPEYDDHSLSELPDELKMKFRINCTIMGYLLHSYKDPSRPWAIVIQEDTSDDGAGGGSGKQIFTKGVSLMRNVIEEDGKQLNIRSQFAFQGLNEEHDVYVLDDVPKWFNIETMYRMITNDMVIEERNKGRKTIKYKDSPKFVYSTNYDILSEEGAQHLRRRIKIMLFNCYFGSNKLPINEVGMLLKDGWADDDPQWMLFYNFMFLCVMAYLNNSVLDVEITDNTKIKSVKNRFDEDFYDWMTRILNEKKEQWFTLKRSYDDFIETVKGGDKKFTYSKFKKGFYYFCNVFKIDFEVNNKYSEKDSDFDIDYEVGRLKSNQLGVFIKGRLDE